MATVRWDRFVYLWLRQWVFPSSVGFSMIFSVRLWVNWTFMNCVCQPENPVWPLSALGQLRIAHWLKCVLQIQSSCSAWAAATEDTDPKLPWRLLKHPSQQHLLPWMYQWTAPRCPPPPPLRTASLFRTSNVSGRLPLHRHHLRFHRPHATSSAWLCMTMMLALTTIWASGKARFWRF